MGFWGFGVLAVHEVIDYKFKASAPDCMTLNEVILKKSENDKWLIDLENLMFVEKGTRLLELDSEVFVAPYDCYLVFPTACERCVVGEELVLLAK